MNTSTGRTEQVRAIALALLRHPERPAVFVDQGTRPGTGEVYHRLAGGGIEHGELARDTVARELAEEYGLQVRVGRRRAVVENIFTFDGHLAHQIVFVFDAELCDPADAQFERLTCRDTDNVGVWRPIDETRVPLYPEAVHIFLDEPQ